MSAPETEAPVPEAAGSGRGEEHVARRLDGKSSNATPATPPPEVEGYIRDPEALYDDLNPDTAIPKKASFRLVRAGSIEPRAPDWLVEGVIERDSLAGLYGPSGDGKTHWAIGLAAAVASGSPFHGRAVQAQPVVMINGEGHRGIVCRQRSHEQAWGVDLTNAPLYFSERPALLCDADSADLVNRAVKEVHKQCGGVGLVVVDTLARNFGGDENSTADMSQFVAHLDRIRADHGCAILVVHHTGHASTQRARGSTALKGALDTEWQLEKGADGLVRVQCSKMKDAPEPSPLAYTLKPVSLDMTDHKGQPVTSAVLEATQWTPPPSKGKGVRLGRNESKALDALRELASAHPSSDTPIPIDHWREACREAGLGRSAVRDVKKSLAQKGLIALDETTVTLEEA